MVILSPPGGPPRWHAIVTCGCGASLLIDEQDLEAPGPKIKCGACGRLSYVPREALPQAPVPVAPSGPYDFLEGGGRAVRFATFPSGSADRAVGDWPRDDEPCPVCGAPRYVTPAGPVCKDGHGG